MLGPSIGITNEQFSHLLDEDPPRGVYSEQDAALIRYVRTLAARDPIDDALYNDLAAHFTEQEMMEICYLVGAQTLIYFFNKTFLADVDEEFVRANAAADRAAGGPPVHYPSLEH